MASRRRRRPQRRRRKPVLLIIEIIIVVLLLGALFAYNKLSLFDQQELDMTKVEVNQIDQHTEEVLQGYTTIACFGLDNRDSGQYKRGNSDVVMLISINNDTKDMKMISVYRDTFLDVSGADENAKYRKCNAAYAYGGAEQAISMLNRNLDISIDNYIAFDWSAVAEAIDILGGVEVPIETEEELKWVNLYTYDVSKHIGTEYTEVPGLGVNTLNGTQAVGYARVRYTAGNDFKRAERQRIVLTQMIYKAKHSNLIELNELVNNIFPDIQTSMSEKDMIEMASALVGYDMSTSGGFPFAKNTKNLGDPYGDVVVPCDLITNVKELHKLLYDNEEYTPSSAVTTVDADVRSLTGYGPEDAIQDQYSQAVQYDENGNPIEAETPEE